MDHIRDSKQCCFFIMPLLFLLCITACTAQSAGETASTPAPAPSPLPTEAAPAPTTPAPTPTAPPTARIIETENFRGVIFSAEQVAAGAYWPNGVDPWTPSEADIVTLEAQLAAYLREPYPDLQQKSAGYMRQYWGTVTKDGDRAIYANLFCDDHGKISEYDWQNNLVQIEDGGDCYFQTLYNVENGRFEWLIINGES